MHSPRKNNKTNLFGLLINAKHVDGLLCELNLNLFNISPAICVLVLATADPIATAQI
jgi:hypothetical protein